MLSMNESGKVSIGVARARKSITAYHEQPQHVIQLRIGHDGKRNGLPEVTHPAASKKSRLSPTVRSDNLKVQNQNINYKCGHCNAYVRNQSDGVLHFRTVHPEKEFGLICEDSNSCVPTVTANSNKQSSNRNGLKKRQPSIKVAISTEIAGSDRNHKLRNDNTVYVCYLCPFQTIAVGELRKHITDQHDWKDIELTGISFKGVRKVFICPICQARFVHSHKFSAHCTEHTVHDILRKSIEHGLDRKAAETREQSTSSPPDQIVNLNSKHQTPPTPTVSTLICQFCYFICHSKVSLNQHLESFHRITKKKWTGYSDTMTKFKYPSERGYTPPPPVDTSCWNLKHIKRVYCNYCEKEIIFNSKETVERHKMKHENVILHSSNSAIIPNAWIQPTNEI